jgi:phosphopantothenoylcysteine decarboxylase/phosphopantothenate--cysteine ligase
MNLDFIPKNLLKNKNVLVGVTGSIAIYKSIQLIRHLTKAGANVRVVMSDSAKKFITPLTFETLTVNKVLHSETEDWSSDLNHIGIGKWADSFIIAPATANTIGKLANGVADNLLLQTALAFDLRQKKILLAPSANTNMLNNPMSEANLKLLKLSNYEIISTQVKELACKTDGDGAMAEPESMFWVVARELLKENFWEYRRVVVSGGGTIEKIDDVRFISNFSSGKMASALAISLYLKGADVCFISSKFPYNLPLEMCRIEVNSAQEMHDYLAQSLRSAKKGIFTKPSLMNSDSIQNIQKKPFLFMASAVSDFTPKYPQFGKLKSNEIGDYWILELKKNIDILQNLEKNDVFTVGFKAEIDKENSFNNASNMIQRKNLDAVCLNVLKDSSSFGTDVHQIDWIDKNVKNIDEVVNLPKTDKLSLAFEILNLSQKLEE